MDMSEDDFFMAGSSGDDADADDEWTDRYDHFGSALCSNFLSSSCASKTSGPYKQFLMANLLFTVVFFRPNYRIVPFLSAVCEY